MEIINFLIPMAIILAGFFIAGFIWMTLKGQYDDLETPGYRMLLEETETKKNINKDFNQTPKGDL
jgi:cbb3-type cytochrome oxidase maturation protein